MSLVVYSLVQFLVPVALFGVEAALAKAIPPAFYTTPTTSETDYWISPVGVVGGTFSLDSGHSNENLGATTDASQRTKRGAFPARFPLDLMIRGQSGISSLLCPQRSGMCLTTWKAKNEMEKLKNDISYKKGTIGCGQLLATTKDGKDTRELACVLYLLKPPRDSPSPQLLYVD